MGEAREYKWDSYVMTNGPSKHTCTYSIYL